MVHGSCLCGEIAWKVSAPFLFASNCHCGRCRKWHGTAFGSYGGVPADAFSWERGADSIVRCTPSGGGGPRLFCGRCGSKLPTDPMMGLVFVTLGTAEGDPGVRPAEHIFVGSKALWHEIADGLPCHDEYPPSIDAKGLPNLERPHGADGRIAGSCLCDGVRYEIAGGVKTFRCCHCSRCRKARGAAYAANVILALDGLAWTKGAERLERYKPPEAERFTHTFCRDCGSSLPSEYDGIGVAVAPAGTLDDDPGVRPRAHIFVGSKAPWFDITDDLPQHEEAPPPKR